MLLPNSSVNLHDHKVARRPQSEKLKNCTSCYCAENSSGSAVTPISRTVLNQKKKNSSLFHKEQNQAGRSIRYFNN